MRIIAGKYRGRRLRAPRGRKIRPTSDRLRESIFNIIGPAIRGHKIVDIFAGTGAMGIEALSRGADHAVFIDKHPLALECLRMNIASLGRPDQWDIIRWDVGSNLRCLAALNMRFSYAFIDPPYNKGLLTRTLANLLASDVMLPGGLMVLEHHYREEVPAVDKRALLADQRRYGKTLVTFLRLMV
jgi:16S rRNA (guanine966-N2)-methyltransferase